MLLNQYLEKIPFLNSVNDVMVCEADAIGMRAAVFHRNRDVLTIALEAHADAIDLTSAVAELVQQLRRQGWVGKQALLLNPAVVQSLIELPIPPKNKLSPQQIAESVRWELEPYLTQQLRYLSIGQILLQNRFIKQEQIEEILAQQEMTNVSKDREVLYKRFGELAIALGYVTQSQLDKCLLKQAWFMTKGDDIQCGWASQSQQANPETNLFAWLAVGMNKNLLRQWQAAFSSQGVKLNYCYPMSGNAFAVVEKSKQSSKRQEDTTQDDLVFEVHESLITEIHLQNGQLKSLQHLALQAEQALSVISDYYHQLGLESINSISLIDAFSRSEQEVAQLAADLQNVVSQPVSTYGRLGHSAHLGFKAVALHFMQPKLALSVAAVPVDEVQPPLMQRPVVRSILASLIMLSLLGLAEGSLQVRQYMIESEKVQVDRDLAKINQAIARVQAKVDKVKKLKVSIKEKQEEIKELNNSIDLLSIQLPNRNQSLTNLLNELNRTVSEDVVIDKIAEDTILGFSMNAWSINEKSAQEFIKSLQIAIHPLGYKLKDITVTEQTGRLGLLGYAVNFNMTSLNDEAWNKAKLQSGVGSVSTANSATIGSR
ncbi:MAG TPA: hypothetical protein DCO68_01295 [Methylophilaceae bacterium]|nr:hypothetical protein [Methylophilaceae bacterium]